MQSQTEGDTFTIPLPLARLPWTRQLSEDYAEAKAESSAWIESFKPFEGKSLEAFRSCNFSLLGSLFYAPREKALVRLGCDFINMASVLDEYTDIEDKSGTQNMVTAMDVMRNPNEPRPEGESCVGAIARDFFLRLRAHVPPDAPCLQHFFDAWENYISAVVQEVEDRSKDTPYQTFEDYRRLRRHSSAGGPCFALLEFGLDIPEEVYKHDLLKSIREKAADILALHNDICSYAMEKSRGISAHNAIEIIIHERGISLQEAMDWVGNYCSDLVDGFLHDITTLPSWELETGEKVSMYVNGLGQMLRGSDDWHFESDRYLGSKGSEIRQTRTVTILPPSSGYAMCGSTEDSGA
ncbi:terpenoid synthase [Macrolepiota fuliginosa MF-IS2]|uniref:Terpene synthase n=1 Tax=Macrolepiota fuliginosa MF-IS2 TaxID=1400762 RepID=A0A9P5X574_9AGAR|nr:terpenoid synthase [Macrolepiota fuliginosa MF-IS2]